MKIFLFLFIISYNVFSEMTFRFTVSSNEAYWFIIFASVKVL